MCIAAGVTRRAGSRASGRRRPKAVEAGGGRGDGGDESNLHFRWIILIGLITAAIMEVLDTTIINVALPQMAGNLNATTDEIAWVSTGYILSNVVVLPMTAWLSQPVRAQELPVVLDPALHRLLVLLRHVADADPAGRLAHRAGSGRRGAAVHGAGDAAAGLPQGAAGMVQTIFILGIVVAPTVGPTLGGIITDNYHWPWCFFINIPIGLVSVSLVWLFLHDTQAQNSTGAIDYIGILLLTAGLGSLQYVLEEGERDDWFDSVAIQRLSLLAAVSLVAMVAWELSPRNTHPIIDFRVLKNRSFTAGLMLFLALGFGLYGGIFIFPLFTQNVLGFSPTATGLVLLPGGLATVLRRDDLRAAAEQPRRRWWTRAS